MMFYDLIPKPREQDPKAGRAQKKLSKGFSPKKTSHAGSEVLPIPSSLSRRSRVAFVNPWHWFPLQGIPFDRLPRFAPAFVMQMLMD